MMRCNKVIEVIENGEPFESLCGEDATLYVDTSTLQDFKLVALRNALYKADESNIGARVKKVQRCTLHRKDLITACLQTGLKPTNV